MPRLRHGGCFDTQIQGCLASNKPLAQFACEAMQNNYTYEMGTKEEEMAKIQGSIHLAFVLETLTAAMVRSKPTPS